MVRVAFVLITGSALQVNDATYRLMPQVTGIIVYTAFWLLVPLASAAPAAAGREATPLH